MKNFGAISDGKDLPIKKYADDRVIANPTLAGTEDDLTSIQIAGVKYKIPEGGAVGGNATAGDIRYPKTAVVNGSLITGSQMTRDYTDITLGERVITVPKGIYDDISVLAYPEGSATTPATTIDIEPDIGIDEENEDIYVYETTRPYITPTVVPGYVYEGTRGRLTIRVRGQLAVPMQGETTYTPTTTDQTILSGTYLKGDQTIEGDANLVAGNIKKDVVIFGVTGNYEAGSGGGGDAVEGDLRAGKTAEVGGILITGTVTERDSTDLTASGDTVTVPAGIYDTAATKAVAAGSAATPATTITPNVGVQLITMIPGGGGDPYVAVRATASGSQSITPTVTPGYVSSGTSGLVTVSGYGGLELTTLNAATYHPSASDQTIAKDQYINGVQTIKGVTTTNLTAENIKAGVVVKIGDSTDDDCVTAVTGNYEPGPGGAGDATAADIRYQKTAVVGGEVVTGSVPERDSTDVTVSGKTVTVPAGIYDAAVSKSVADGLVRGASMAGTGTLHPTITVSNTGLITASAGWTGNPPVTVVTPGYIVNDADHVQSGTIELSGSTTQQLTTQAATTYTPTTTDQTIASGTYLTGAQTISGDANLVAGNIKKDVSIFGVTGIYEGSGGGSSATEPYIEETYDSSGNLTAVSMHGYTKIRKYMFYECGSLAMTEIPSGVTEIGDRAFQECSAITLDLLPSSVTDVGSRAFIQCSGLTNVEIAATRLSTQVFSACSNLAKVWFRSTCTTIIAATASNSPFVGCSTSLKIYCEASSKPSGYGSYFNRTGTSGGTTVSVVYNRTTKPW